MTRQMQPSRQTPFPPPVMITPRRLREAPVDERAALLRRRIANLRRSLPRVQAHDTCGSIRLHIALLERELSQMDAGLAPEVMQFGR